MNCANCGTEIHSMSRALCLDCRSMGKYEGEGDDIIYSKEPLDYLFGHTGLMPGHDRFVLLTEPLDYIKEPPGLVSAGLARALRGKSKNEIERLSIILEKEASFRNK